MDRFLADEFHFAGLETDAGWIARGEVEVVFDRDGTSVYSEILLESDAGDRLVLEIQPLADAVQVRHEGV